jgi:hypothetical protein
MTPLLTGLSTLCPICLECALERTADPYSANYAEMIHGFLPLTTVIDRIRVSEWYGAARNLNLRSDFQLGEESSRPAEAPTTARSYPAVPCMCGIDRSNAT